ncbi:hypothetical protein V2J09_008370 [Rumex salicifolius]
MADPFTPSYVEEPNNMISAPSSNSEDANLTCSCNRDECHCEEQHQHQRQQKKNKKRRRKISHIIKYVVGFSFVKKKLKTTKNSHKKRRDDNDNKINPTPTRIHECLPPQSSPLNDYPASSSPFHGFEDVDEPTEEESAAAAGMSSTGRIFGMHHIMPMISLAAVVLSGKACAIFATIVWLILLPLTSRFSNGRRPRWALQLGRKCDDRDSVVRNFMARF